MIALVLDEPCLIKGFGHGVTVDVQGPCPGCKYDLMRVDDERVPEIKRSSYVEFTLDDTGRPIYIGPSDQDPDPAAAALSIALQYGHIDGDHHKMWVIDQIVRTLAGDRYEQTIADYENGEDGPCSYEWDTGIAP